MGKGCGNEDDGESKFDEDEGEFDPKGDAEDAMLSIVNAEALILGAEEDGGEDETADEDEEEAIMESVMSICVKDGEEDEACGASDGEDDGEDGEDFLRGAGIGDQSARVSKPAFGHEAQVKGNRCDDAAGDEQRLEPVGSDVGNVGNVLALFHAGVLRRAADFPMNEHGE